MSAFIGRKVVVTTDKRGVFFGTLTHAAGGNATLANARNCLYWSRAVKGFIGLAVTGPDEGSRVGPAAPEMELAGVTSITACTDAAAKQWEAAPWAS